MTENVLVIDGPKIPLVKRNKLTRQELLARIEQRRAKLHQVAEELKKHFVGLDTIIDKIMGNIEVWYIFPEIISHPVIINLWGMTGVGKTDLVRRLVRALNFSDSFVEVQLTNKGSSSDIYSSSIQSILGSSNLEPENPGILLLDEIQRFRSVDEHGTEIHDYRFQDVWMLLSDGRFSGATNGKERLFEMLFDYKYWEDYRASEEDENDDENENVTAPSPPQAYDASSPSPLKKEKSTKKKIQRRYFQSYYSARLIKRFLRLPNSIEDIMTWDDKKKNAILLSKINDPNIYEGDDYSKLLVFVSGNLDEAYMMSDRCEDVDIDADVFHDFSLNINILSIKKALKERFKPEQISRLGNVHVIYPSLSRKSYEQIIERKVNEVVENIFKKSGVRLIVDKSIKNFIYRNGVFPAQGVRPLFSTISSFLENSLPSLILVAIEQDARKVIISYSDNHICGEIRGNTHKIKFDEGDIDRIKNEYDEDKHVIIAVHEAGHAVMYATLLGLVPVQIVSNAASDGYHNGFTGFHEITESKQLMLDKIAVSLAGQIAEMLVFGDEHRTGGAIADIGKATQHAVNMVRSYGMYGFQSKRQAAEINDGSTLFSNHDIEPTNSIIENIIQEQYVRAEYELKKNLSLLQAISAKLLEKGTIGQEEFQQLCSNHGIKTTIFETKKAFCPGYVGKYHNFFKTNFSGEKK